MNKTVASVPTLLRQLADDIDRALVAETRRDIRLLARAEQVVRAALMNVTDPARFAQLEADGASCTYDLWVTLGAYGIDPDPAVVEIVLRALDARGGNR